MPFLLVALGFNWVSGAMSWLKRNIRVMNILGGVTLTLIGVLMVTGVWTAWMTSLQAFIGGFVLPI